MRKIENLSTAAFVMAFSLLASRLLGYGREMLLAYTFGASATTDAFYAAFQIPDFLNYFLAGGALSVAFIPLYNRRRAEDGDAAALTAAGAVLGTLGFAVIGVTAVLWVLAEPLVQLQFPRFSPETTALTVHLTRIVLPAQIFLVIGGTLQALLLAQKHFTASALAPLIYNACTIAGGIFFHDALGIDGFAVGTLIGAALGPFLMPLLFMRGYIKLRPVLSPLGRDFKAYLALAAPLMCGQTLLTLDEWYGRWFGGLLAEGTVAHISYARRLMLVPIGVIGQAFAAAALPTLSKLWAEQKIDELNKTLRQTLDTALALAIVAGGGIAVTAPAIVALVYQHGAFDAGDAAVVSGLLFVLAFAIPAWILQQVIMRAFYARGDTRRPMILGTWIALLAAPFYYAMAKMFGVSGIVYAGLAGMSINALATLLLAGRSHGAPRAGDILRGQIITFLPAVAAAVTVIVAAPVILPAFSVFSLSDKWSALLDLIVRGGLFSLVALVGIATQKNHPLRDFIYRRILKRSR